MDEGTHPFKLLVVFFGLSLVFIIVSSHMKAKAFNRITGKDVTTWEAMWVDLKVTPE